MDGHCERSHKKENILETVNWYKGLMNRDALNNLAFDSILRTYPIYQCNHSKNVCDKCAKFETKYPIRTEMFKRLSFFVNFCRFINPLTSILLGEMYKPKTKHKKVVADKSSIIEWNLAILINQTPITRANYNKMNNIF
jgi:hypothetical protein